MYSDETKKFLERVIMRQTEILNGQPFLVRDKLREFNKKLEDSLSTGNEKTTQ